jgi:hypothetical protein
MNSAPPGSSFLLLPRASRLSILRCDLSSFSYPYESWGTPNEASPWWARSASCCPLTFSGARCAMRYVARSTGVRAHVQAGCKGQGSLLTVPGVEAAKWCPVNTKVANRMKGGSSMAAHQRWRWRKNGGAGRVDAVWTCSRAVPIPLEAKTTATSSLYPATPPQRLAAPVAAFPHLLPFFPLLLLLSVVARSGGHQGGSGTDGGD